jgi:hypothetical protein
MPSILSPRLSKYISYLFAICFALLFSSDTLAQSFGGFSPSLKWYEIDTDTVRVIYPKGHEQQAQRLVNAIHYLKKNDTESIGDQAFKIDIVLNNQTTVTNGSVGIAPWKSHFITTPLQNSFALSALPWMDLLAVHEYRHVIQLSTARRGVSKLLYTLFGEESWSGAANLAVPDWFLEGDAVWAETSLSTQGRGRIPSFLRAYRALSIEDLPTWNYTKVRNGSIKHFIPNEYPLGYMLTAYGYENYGDTFWKSILKDAASFRGIFYPFSKALETKTGLSTKAFYHKVLEEKRVEWKSQQGEILGDVIVKPSSKIKTFTHFQYPYVISPSGDLIYYVRSFEKTGFFQRLNTATGEVSKVVNRGISVDDYYGYKGGWLTWSEYSVDPRWSEKDYSDIVIFNIDTKVKKRITRKKRYFSPFPTTDGSKIVVVDQASNATSTLVLLDQEGRELERASNPDRFVFTFPRFYDQDQSIVVAARNTDGEMAVLSYGLESKQFDVLVPFSNNIIGAPMVENGVVYFSSTGHDREQIVSVDLTSSQRLQLTDAPNGAFEPVITGDTLFYVSFTSMGNRIRSRLIDRSNIQSLETAPVLPFQRNIFKEFPEETYTSEKYRPLLHSINFHTWGFDYDDPVISLRALSTNVLNNVELAAGVNYNYDRDVYQPFGRLRVSALYPDVSLGVSTAKRSAVFEDELNTWREWNLSASLSVPLNYSRGLYRRTFVPEIGILNTTLTGDLDLSFVSAFGSLTFIHERIKARKNLFTRNGQYLRMGITESIDDFQARELNVRTGLSLPGIGINHNTVLHADYLKNIEGADYKFLTGLQHRGLGVVPADEVWRLSANYHFPILYPDWGFAGLIYFYRVRANLFYDYSRATVYEGGLNNYHTSGVELVFDINLVNSVETNFGIRYTYGVDTQTPVNQFEFFLPVYRFQ